MLLCLAFCCCSYYQFEASLRMDKHLSRLYECCEGAQHDAVDCREVAAGVLLLRQHRRIQEHGRDVLLHMVDVYMPDEDTLLRKDLLKVSTL